MMKLVGRNFMKKAKSKIIKFLIVFICFCVYCEIQYRSSHATTIVLKTSKDIGEKISLLIEKPAGLIAGSLVWVDLNNNGKRDKGEGVDQFGSLVLHHGYTSFIIQSKTITIHGKIRGLSCIENDLETIDVTNATSLEKLDCSRNKLTELDVSKCKKLYLLHCYFNSIKQDAMTALINSLPRYEGKDKGEFVIQCFDKEKYLVPEGNEYLSESIKKAKDKNWRVWVATDIQYSSRWRRLSTEL